MMFVCVCIFCFNVCYKYNNPYVQWKAMRKHPKKISIKLT